MQLIGIFKVENLIKSNNNIKSLRGREVEIAQMVERVLCNSSLLSDLGTNPAAVVIYYYLINTISEKELERSGHSFS